MQLLQSGQDVAYRKRDDMGNVITRLPNVRESHLFCRPFDCSFLLADSEKYNADVDEGEQVDEVYFDFGNFKLMFLLKRASVDLYKISLV